MDESPGKLRNVLGSTKGLLGLLALTTLGAHVIVARTTAYGLHRDEYLYLSFGRHLDWGFLEAPPGIGLVAAGLESTIGTSLVAVRLVPALVHAALVCITGLIARELGGNRFSILVAALAVLIAPVYLRAGTLFQPVPFDQLAWAAAALFVVRRIRRDDVRQWLGLGLVCGLAVAFKYTILLFAAGLFVGLLLSPYRGDLNTAWPWAGAVLAAAFALPNLIWQAGHEWPVVRHAKALSESQLAFVGRFDFLVEQVLMLHPITLPIWGAGLYYFFSGRARRFRILGWTYVVCLGLLLVLRGKPYYLAPAYPMLLAGGALAVDRLVRRWHPGVLRPLLAGALLLSGIAFAPIGVPVLPPPAMAEYLDTIGIQPESETGRSMRLPQDYADMLGWPEMAKATADVYHTLPPTERKDAMLFGESYGHAGVIDYFRSELDVPPAVSASGSYYLWGPSDERGSVGVFVGLPMSDVSEFYGQCTVHTVVRHEWAHDDEEPVIVCREPNRPVRTVWPSLEPW